MKICFVADVRSPIARNWINGAIQRGHHVSVLSSYPYEEAARIGDSCIACDVAFGRVKERVRIDLRNSRGSMLGQRLTVRLAEIGECVRMWLGPLEVQRNASAIRAHIDRIQPEVVHALRVPFEGMVAAAALKSEPRTPLIVSTWGNDLTLFAARYATVGWFTRRTLARANGLHADCRRDAALAEAWGFDASRPTIVAPGNGGVDPMTFRPGPVLGADLRARLEIPRNALVILQPRGIRGYVRNDTFFAAVPQVLSVIPNAVFVVVGMEGHPRAAQWWRDCACRSSVRMLGLVDAAEMADLFRLSTAFVSITEHDGTPNTLLEGMACGSLPIVGDIESIREWIVDGVNGLACGPGDAAGLARCIVRAVQDPALLARAREQNSWLVSRQATIAAAATRIDAFYESVLRGAGRTT